jgi:hypothetical protein
MVNVRTIPEDNEDYRPGMSYIDYTIQSITNVL